MIDRGPIVIYDSETGFTAKYALWIGEKLKCPFISIKEAAVKPLQHYQTLIFGGRMICEKPVGFDFLKKHLEEFPEQNLVVYVTGSGDYSDMDWMKEKIFGEDVKKAAGIYSYFLHSGLNYDRMSKSHRLLMRLFCLILRLKGQKEDAGRLSESFDESRPEYVDDLVATVQKISK